MVVYISGPITGTKDYLERFENVHQRLIDANFDGDVINPAYIMDRLPAGTPHETYMKISMALLENADIMLLLDGWEKSSGCLEEVAYASEKNILIVKEVKDYERTNT